MQILNSSPRICRSISCGAQREPREPVQITRRQSLAALPAAAFIPVTVNFLSPPAQAAPPPPLSLEEVTPTLAPAAPLTHREQLVTDVFARTNPGVVTFFDATLPISPPSGPAAVEQPEGNGSGFVWDSQGHIVTNYHVLGNALSGAAGKLGNNAKVATVFLLNSDGYQQAYDGYLVGADKARDLAVVKVNAPKEMLHPLPRADASTPLKIGQSVLAIGAPFGFEHTLTTGVVSATGRGFQSQTGSIIGGGIQTDCSLNPGNSGGPLIDLSGRVVGINTAIFTNTGASVGVGFSLPIEIALRVVPQLISDGKVTRASLGVTPATDNIARAFKVSEGVLLAAVDPTGPAAAAGLLATRRGFAGVLAGDVIVGIGGKQVRSTFDLSAALDALTAGESVAVEVLRGIESPHPEKITIDIVLSDEN